MSGMCIGSAAFPIGDRWTRRKRGYADRERGDVMERRSVVGTESDEANVCILVTSLDIRDNGVLDCRVTKIATGVRGQEGDLVLCVAPGLAVACKHNSTGYWISGSGVDASGPKCRSGGIESMARPGDQPEGRRGIPLGSARRAEGRAGIDGC
jgi:hypothetical protein